LKYLKKISLLLILVLACKMSFSQHKVFDKIPDSLNGKNTKQLELKYINNRSNPFKSGIYANSYLLKAKQNENLFEVFAGFAILSRHVNNNLKKSYLDSAVYYAKKTKNKENIARILFVRGRYYHQKGNLEAALKDYLKSQRIAHLNKDTDGEFRIKHRIGWLKNDLGEEREALKLFRDYYKYIYSKFYKSKTETNKRNYVNSLYDLANSYNRNRKLDSAAYIIDIGIKKSLKYNREWTYNHLVLSSGVNSYLKGNYDRALDSLQKTETYLSKNNINGNLEVNYYYTGKSYEKKDEQEKAINYLQKMDSVRQIEPYASLYFRDGYESLIDYYRKVKNKDKQLEYIGKLLQMDSLLYQNQGHLIKEISKKYETPQLLKDKELLISKLTKDKNQSYTGLGVLGGISLILGSFLFYYFRKQKFYKKRFEEILTTEPSDKSQISNSKSQSSKLEGISKEVINQIKNGLQGFEKEESFLENTITLNVLAKELEANTNYLSKVINFYKQKNFSSYLNDLRIEYAISQLKTNPQFKRYSVKGMAREVGFNNETSFSKAFYKRTGLCPSYFLKELEKRDKNASK